MKTLLCILLLSAITLAQMADARRQEHGEHECKASPFPGVLLAPPDDQRIIGNHSLIFDGSEFHIELNPVPGLVPFVIHSPFANGIELYTHADAGFRSPFLVFYKSGGTRRAPSPVPYSGVYEADSLGGINFGGWDGVSYFNASAAILTLPDENWTATAHGGHLSIYGTNKGGSNTQQIAQFGGLDATGLGGTNNILFLRALAFQGNQSGNPALIPFSNPPVLKVRTADNLHDAAFAVGSLAVTTSHTPATAFETCDPGAIAWDPNFVYVCVAPNTWRRSALAAW